MTFQSNVTYHKGEYTGEQSHVIPINTARQTNIKLETNKKGQTPASSHFMYFK